MQNRDNLCLDGTSIDGTETHAVLETVTQNRPWYSFVFLQVVKINRKLQIFRNYKNTIAKVHHHNFIVQVFILLFLSHVNIDQGLLNAF